MNLLRRIGLPKYSLGIDFGTTTSRLCYIANDRRIYVPPKVRPVRSVVTPYPKGAAGKYEWHVDEDVIYSFWAHYSRFKLRIGDMVALELKPQRKPDEIIAIRPEILAARLMWVLYSREHQINSDLKGIRNVAITVPAEWNALQRQATILAAKIAGFVDVHLIEEPVAAFLAVSEFHQDDRLRQATNTLVFDYGGGTLDITVVHRPKRGGAPYVVGRAMEEDTLGGEAIDDRLCQLLIGKSTWEKLDERDRRWVANKVKELKEDLNPINPGKEPLFEAKARTAITLPDSRLVFSPEELKLEYSALEQVLLPIAQEVEELLNHALRSAKLEAEDIQAVILVGGSSYLRVIQQAITGYFSHLRMNDGIYLEQPEEVVAIGAALYQSYLDRGEGKQKFRLRLPMKTYFEYEVEQNGNSKTEQLTLGTPENVVPIKPKVPPICRMPSKAGPVRWQVKQSHTYSSKVPDVVEQVIFDSYEGGADRLRLEYQIDLNGCLIRWEPKLIIRQKKKPITGSPRRYDWLDQSAYNLAKEFGVDS